MIKQRKSQKASKLQEMKWIRRIMIMIIVVMAIRNKNKHLFIHFQFLLLLSYYFIWNFIFVG